MESLGELSKLGEQSLLPSYIGVLSGKCVDKLDNSDISKEIIIRLPFDLTLLNPKDPSNLHKKMTLKQGFMYLIPESWFKLLLLNHKEISAYFNRNISERGLS